MPYKTLLIFNPIANLGRAWRLADSLRAAAAECGGADWKATEYPGHAVELARQAGEAGYELVVAMGGDGTVHEVVNGLMQLQPEHRPHLGVIPTGSGNDFSYALKLPGDPAQALRQVLSGVPIPVDIGRVTDEHGHSQYWCNAIGIGFDTIVTIHTRQGKIFQGFMVFLLSVLQTILFDYKPFHIQYNMDGKTHTEDSIMMVLCNGGREGGGFYVAPNADPCDGVFQYVGVRRISRLQMLTTLPHFLKGTQNGLPQVFNGGFQNLNLKSDQPLFIHADGEIIAGTDGEVKELTVEMLPGALKAVC